MTARESLATTSRPFLDTAPLIYFLEANPRYLPALVGLFQRLDGQEALATTSRITLAECLVQPLVAGNRALADAFSSLIVHGRGVTFVPIGATAAALAAELRARHRLTLTDALQVAVAIDAQCDLFVTNDLQLQRLVEIPVLVLEQVLHSLP